MVKELFSTLNTRPDGVCNFIDASKWFGKGARIVYRQYATLYFIFAIDASESELGILDLIQARAPRVARRGGVSPLRRPSLPFSLTSTASNSGSREVIELCDSDSSDGCQESEGAAAAAIFQKEVTKAKERQRRRPRRCT